MNKLFTKIATLGAGLAMAIGVGVAVGAKKEAANVHAESNDVYYTFNNKNWTSNMSTTDYALSGGTSKKWSGVVGETATDGNQLTSGQGVQVVTGISGIVVTCPDSYNNITNVVVRYCTNSKSGVGSISAKVGSTAGSPTSVSVPKPSSGGTTLKNASFTFSSVSGAVNFTVGCSTNSLYIYGVKITYTTEDDPDQPSVSITNNNLYAPKNVGVSLSASTENAPAGSYVEWSANNNKVSFSSTTGTSTTLTAASDATVSTTAVVVTATLKNSGGESLDAKTTKLYISSASGSSTSTAMPASEAALFATVEELRDNTIYVKGFVTNIPGNSTKYFWIDDNEGTTQTFEVYRNETGFSNGTSLGAFVVAHGTLAIYNSTKETTDSVIDSSDYFALSDAEVEVDNTQYVDVTASDVSSGNISWSKTAGTGDVTLSNQSNSGVRITGNGVGTATVTATLGGLVRNISVTVNSYADDWVYSDITLTTKTGFQTLYSVGEPLDTDNLVVTVIEYSATLDDTRDIVINNDDVEFNFDSSSAATIDLTATYGGHTTDDAIQVEVQNIATIVLNDANTTSFWAESSSYCGRHGVVGSGSAYGAFDGIWYNNSGFQMNKTANGAYISNAISVGTIKTIVLNVTTGSTNSSQFSMYYGTAANPSTNKITPSVSSGTWTYDFSEVTATYFNLAKDVDDGNTVISSITITYTPSDSLDRSEAGAYSDYFLSVTNGLCDADGIENGVADVWDKLSGVYALLSSATKASLKAKAIAEAGETDGTTVGEAMARYYWAVKNHDANTDFIGDGDVSAASVMIGLGIDAKESSTITIIIVVAMTGLIAISGYFFLRKRKQQ